MNSHDSSPNVLRMAAPLVVSFWMRAAVTFVDTVYASFIGDEAVAAIGLTLPMEFLMIAAWVGLSTGLTSCLSRAMGSGKGRQIQQYLAVARRLVAALSPVFALVGAAVWPLAPRLGLESETARAFQLYGTVLIAGSAFTTFWSIVPDSLIKAHQDTRSTMWAGIWSNVINVGLNTLFVFTFGWGILGIALSTVLGRIGGLLYALARARTHEAGRLAGDDPRDESRDPAPLAAILRLAVPSSLTFGLMATETAVINALLARLDHPTEAIAAYSIYYRVVLFALQPVIAMSVALLPFAARRHGQGDHAGIRRGLRQAMLATSLYAVLVLAPILIPAAPWIASRLAESEATLRYTIFALRCAPLACLLGTPFLLCRPVFEAMHRGRPGLLIALLRYVVLTAPLAWAGMAAAAAFDYPPLYGLIVGTVLAGAIPSVVFYLWLGSVLPADRSST